MNIVYLKHKFGVKTTYLGRNGYMGCGGIEVSAPDNKRSIVRLTPINGRGDISSSSYIDIPKEDINALVRLLIDAAMGWEKGGEEG